jgi:lysine 2,3-aminomutase
MTKTIKTLSALDERGFLPEGVTPALEEAVRFLPVGVTADLLGLIDAKDPEDPIARQFVPREEESVAGEGMIEDPIGDESHAPIAGILHYYADRLLFNPVSSCGAYCRFCFRRKGVGRGDGMLDAEAVERALAYIAEQKAVREVIFSGGDPLTLSDKRFGSLVARLNAMPHIKILRIHTRMPVVDPARITDSFLRALEGRCPVYLFLHCNHPRELTSAARAACRKLADAGVVLLSQSVLLRGVNDDPDVLEELMKAFVENRILPHYIHHPDKAMGTAHFRFPLGEGLAIMKELEKRLSGLPQPAYILSIPGGGGKINLNAANATPNEDGTWRLTAPDGRVVVY